MCFVDTWCTRASQSLRLQILPRPGYVSLCYASVYKLPSDYEHSLVDCLLRLCFFIESSGLYAVLFIQVVSSLPVVGYNRDFKDSFVRFRLWWFGCSPERWSVDVCNTE